VNSAVLATLIVPVGKVNPLVVMVAVVGVRSSTLLGNLRAVVSVSINPPGFTTALTIEKPALLYESAKQIPKLPWLAKAVNL